MGKKNRKNKDPFYAREAEKYQNPIPSREFIIEFLEKRGLPARRGEIIEALNIESDEQKEALRRRLRAMERDGQIIFTRGGGYGLVDRMNLVHGRVSGHKDGYGFVIPEDGSPDLFLNAYQMRAVFDGDRVIVRIVSIDRKGRREAEIVDVLERSSSEIVGRYFIEQGNGVVIPENQKNSQNILIQKGQEKDAKEGQYVVARIIAYPTLRTQAIGQISEVIGDHMAPGMEIDVAIRSFNLPYLWPDTVSQEIEQFQEYVSDSDKTDRVDLRDKLFITIDGEDAKDFDDAVCCEAIPRGGWRLYVAIADVSHYVKPYTALDQEAQKRGNSVYFPARVIPMLPEILSNGLCSLKPNQDRLALVCKMELSKTGAVKHYEFLEAVIHSKARMTYTNVTKILVQQNKTLLRQYKEVLPNLEKLYQLYHILIDKRKTRGALEFETVETRVIYGKNRKIEAIVPTERTDAHKLIEECMLIANVCAAKFLIEHLPHGLFRVHEGPPESKLADLRKFLLELGLVLKSRKQPLPKDYAELIRSIQERPDKRLIQTVLLRSLAQAVYSPEKMGHFGLAYDHYTHFTSPIRRYPDLVVHRLIRSILRHKPLNLSHAELTHIGEHCSMTERRADEATRDVVFWLKCEFMQDKVGEEFDGIITGVAGFGIFVELENVYIEGLVHVTGLGPDYFHFDAVKHRLLGERTRIMYRIGDRVRIRVVRVLLDDRKIDFELVSVPQVKKSRKKLAKDTSQPNRTKKSAKKTPKAKVKAAKSAKKPKPKKKALSKKK